MRYPAERVESALPLLVEGLRVMPGLKFAFLHGSAGEGREFRDLDVAALAEGVEDPLRFILVWGQRLEDLVKLPVDLHLLNQAPLGFNYEVSKGRLLLAPDEEALADWRESTWTRYLRQQPYDRMWLKEALGGTSQVSGQCA